MVPLEISLHIFNQLFFGSREFTNDLTLPTIETLSGWIISTLIIISVKELTLDEVTYS
jgi:hypothetical protein